MKKMLLVVSCALIAVAGFAQADTIQPPYKKFPTFPPVKLLMPDSVSFYTKAELPKKKPVMLMLFNPQCDHCQHETEALIQNIDKFKDIQVVMATTALHPDMMAFREKYKLAQYENIVVCRDTDYFLFSFFGISNFPYHAFYNKKKELISVFQGSMTVDKILAQLNHH